MIWSSIALKMAVLIWCFANRVYRWHCVASINDAHLVSWSILVGCGNSHAYLWPTYSFKGRNIKIIANREKSFIVSDIEDEKKDTKVLFGVPKIASCICSWGRISYMLASARAHFFVYLWRHQSIITQYTRTHDGEKMKVKWDWQRAWLEWNITCFINYSVK